MTKTAVIIAIGRRSGRRSGPRSMNGSSSIRIIRIVGTPMVASGTSNAGLMMRRSSKRKKKYHSGRGTRSEERRVGKSVDLGGRRIIKKKKEIHYSETDINKKIDDIIRGNDIYEQGQ